MLFDFIISVVLILELRNIFIWKSSHKKQSIFGKIRELFGPVCPSPKMSGTLDQAPPRPQHQIYFDLTMDTPNYYSKLSSECRGLKDSIVTRPQAIEPNSFDIARGPVSWWGPTNFFSLLSLHPRFLGKTRSFFQSQPQDIWEKHFSFQLEDFFLSLKDILISLINGYNVNLLLSV